MKKILIASTVGAIILFLWGFLSWAILPLHFHTYMHSQVQDPILKILANSSVETGAYLLPMADNRNLSYADSKYREESKRVMTENNGKPMATVYYLKEGYDASGMTFLRGFLFTFLSALAACLILSPGLAAMNSFFGRWWLTLLVGLLIGSAGPLMQYNWMGMPWKFTVDMLADSFLNWAVVGLWFAWYLKNK